MHIGHVRVRVPQAAVLMGMRVWFARRVVWGMCVLVMLVVYVRMSMRHRFVHMLVSVAFSQVQPHAERHQRAGDGELQGHRLVEGDHGGDAAVERRGREIGAGARGAEVAQRRDEQREAVMDEKRSFVVASETIRCSSRQ